MGDMADSPFKTNERVSSLGKNLRSPASNANEPPREELAPIPVTPDPSVNEERVNTTLDGERPIRWPPPDPPDGGRPYKNLK